VKLTDQQILDQYAVLMEQIKWRVDGIEFLIRQFETADQFRAFYLESCYLQIRKVCESFAMAIALAHNELLDFRKNKILKEWQAEKLVNHMLRLKPNCLPYAVKLNRDVDPPKFEKLNFDFTIKDIIQFYRLCGEKLHSKTLKSLLNGDKIKLSLNEIVDWVSAFKVMVSNHLIDLQDIDKILVVAMSSAEHDGNVHCSLSKAVEYV